MKGWALAATTAATALWLALPASLVLVATTAGADTAPCSPGGPAAQVAGLALDAEQLANAHTIVTVVTAHGPPATARAAVIALATAIQESGLRNDLRQRDHDSIGLFQQRISIYGAATAGDPVRATQAFLTKLFTIPGWDTRPLTDVAAQVQIPRADLRGRYAHWEPLAQALTGRYWATAATGCAGTADDADLRTTAGLPPGYQLPTDPTQRTVVAYALAQLGKPYMFGAEGPDAYDCSGLTQAAWAAAGVPIPRTTDTQIHTGTPVPALAALQPGDLIFIPGADGTITHPGHVGLAIGPAANGNQYLIQAPRTGQPVQITPTTRWAGQIAAIRRPVHP